MIVAVVLLGLFSQSLAFQCDAMFSHRECGQFNKASASLNNIVQTADQAVAEAMIKMADETASMYKTMFPILSKIDFNGKVIKIDDNTFVRISKNMTQAEFQQIFAKFLDLLKNLKNIGIGGFGDLDELSKTIESVLTKSLTPATGNMYYDSSEVDEHWETAKASIKKALEHVNVFMRFGVLRVVERFHGHVKNFTAAVDETLEKFGITSKHWSAVKTAIDNALELLKVKTAGDVLIKTGNAVAAAETDLVAMLDVMSQQKPIVKRGITDSIKGTWEKVKAAVSNLSVKVKDATMKVIEEYKPKVIASLENVKRIVIDGAKQIIIEINGTIVKVLTDGVVGASE